MYVVLVLWNVALARLVLMVSMNCVPSCGFFTARVRIITAVCRFSIVLTASLVAVMELSFPWWHMGLGAPLISTLPVNLVLLDNHCRYLLLGKKSAMRILFNMYF